MGRPTDEGWKMKAGKTNSLKLEQGRRNMEKGTWKMGRQTMMVMEDRRWMWKRGRQSDERWWVEDVTDRRWKLEDK